MLDKFYRELGPALLVLAEAGDEPHVYVRPRRASAVGQNSLPLSSASREGVEAGHHLRVGPFISSITRFLM